jgi:stage II sporulation protein D
VRLVYAGAMNLRFLPTLFLLSAATLAAALPVRIGLDTQATEWTISLEGGGEVRSRAGKPILKLKDGEKLRIWWDSRGEADPTDEYRVQVGPPLEQKDAEILMAKLRRLGEQPERLRVPDGDTWRVLAGHFETTGDAEVLVQKLGASGYEELWISTEARAGKPRKGRALYGVTERYERRPLPLEGVRLVPAGELTTVLGKGRYRGQMEIYPNAQGRLTVMNTLELETYLRGVVPREMGAWEYPSLEALKAQAVAARTYVVANRGKREKEGFDLVDTVADQVYGGRDGEQSLTDRAVEETRGLVATFGGKPIQALFMADSGGGTVDNLFVFGGGYPYLKAASNYVAAPLTLPFKGAVAPKGDQGWLTWELLRLASADLIPGEMLDAEHMGQPLNAAEVRPAVETLARRLNLAVPQRPLDQGARLYLWMARSLGLDQVVEGMERPQDAVYFLGAAELKSEERLLATFLARRGLVNASAWKGQTPTLAQGLQALGRMWQELEPLELMDGTLLRDGQVRVKNGGPGPLILANPLLLAEEAPGGVLRLVGESAVQVGDRIKWLPGSHLLVRRLDPDGASLDRYNPTAHWKVELKEAELLDKLKQKGGIEGFTGMELVHNEYGRVLEMIVRDGAGRSHRFTGMRIRNLLGFKDNVFRFLQVGEKPLRRWIFFGRGWGHGVGMDQSGAYGYSLEGWTFDRILKHYYQGIELTQVE